MRLWTWTCGDFVTIVLYWDPYSKAFRKQASLFLKSQAGAKYSAQETWHRVIVRISEDLAFSWSLQNMIVPPTENDCFSSEKWLFLLLYRWEKWGVERARVLSEITWLRRSSAAIKIQVSGSDTQYPVHYLIVAEDFINGPSSSPFPVSTPFAMWFLILSSQRKKTLFLPTLWLWLWSVAS